MALTRTYWQGMTPRAPWTDEFSPNLRLIAGALMARGGQPLTSLYPQPPRPIRGGTSPSTHSFHAAYDWRYENVGAGYRELSRDAMLRTVLPWLIEHHEALGVQQIHDYYGARIWRCDRNGAGLPGWKSSTGSGMGDSWARYLHVEVNLPSWNDRTPLAMRGVPTLPTNTTDPTPKPGDSPMTTPVTFDHVQLTTATPGPDKYVAAWQALINELAGAGLVVDGHYGAKTAAAVENLQRWYHLTIDGKLGPQTARALLDR